ncbi:MULTISPECIES: diguanylate cyclase [Saccharibacillus]|uniref:diguanylate cyclase n=1 Tax=Saccharibacillus TaxID=456492 RepID=UPI001239DFA7|nr:diguanylate cyclase [Saccharibacillus sp. WB 17]MWJ33046.1 diguanylate cyclase [Saccharibacillus sp. WB 17]
MQTIDHFNILETFSEYGRRAVYRAVNNKTGETVILKVLRGSSADSHEVFRFKREYRLLERLSAEVEGVIRPLRLEERGGLLLLEQEDVGGLSLDRIWAESPPDPASFLRAMAGFIDILGEVHARGVLHKDVKPANLIWNRDTDTLRLIDFGLSAETTPGEPAPPQPEHPEGSLSYMSPEQTGRLNRGPDARSDYYAFGVTLYELATGTKPYPEEEAPEYLYSLMAKTPAAPHEVAPQAVSGSLSGIIMKLLAKSPEDRYQSAYGIKADLLRCLAGEETFEPGASDRTERFELPSGLYGRQSELRQAESALGAAVGAPPRLVLVAGEAGAGKTAFVRELRPAVVRHNGRFAEGKCDPYNRSVPHAAVVEAFRGLIVRMGEELGDALPQHSETARSLRRELDGSGSLVLRLIPELADWIGPQPELPALGPAEDTNRFFMTFAAFARGLLDGGRPLLLFLDDMHRADAAEMQLVERLLLDPELRGLCVVCAYRSDEAEAGHPLRQAQQRIGALRGVTELELGALPVEALEEIVADALHADRERIAPLAESIRQHTRGNALFAREMLRELHRDKRLVYEPLQGRWNWEAQAIAALPVRGSVLSLLMERLRHLSPDTLGVLALGAVLGSGFDRDRLIDLGESESGVIDRALAEALAEELIVRDRAGESFGRSAGRPGTAVLRPAAGAGPEAQRFRFRHDRIQQAAYELRTPEEIGRLHLRIGRALLDRQSRHGRIAPIGADERLETAAHLNAGRAWIESEAELGRLIRLNVEAAAAAKASYGYDTALALAGTALELLGERRWETEPDLARGVLALYAECGYLCRRVAEADAACAELAAQARDSLERAKLYEMQAGYYFYLGLMKESIEAGRSGLARLGIRLPEKAGMPAVLSELAGVKLKLASTSVRKLEQGPEMSDPRVKLAMRLLIGMFPPAFISGEQPLFGLIVLKKAGLTLKYGIAPESTLAFTGYALLLSGMGDIRGAYEFGSLALRINERFDDLQSRSAAQVLFALFARVWKEPWRQLPDAFAEAVQSGQRSGNLLYLAHACYYVNLWNPDLDLSGQIEQSGRYIALIENTGHREALATARLARQQWRGLAGLLDDPLSFNGPDFSETAYLEQLEQANYQSGIAIYHVYKMKQLFTGGLYGEAADALERAEAVIGALAGSAFMEEFALYAFLICAYAPPSADASVRRRRHNRMRREFRRFRVWHKHNPANFAWHVRLLAAERARLNGRTAEAFARYDLASDEAERSAPVRYKALSFELSAAFRLERGQSEYGTYLRGKAVYYYAVWGAESKVRQLNESRLAAGVSRTLDRTRPGSLSASSDSLDLDALLLASQAISREIELDHLLQALMEIVIKNAGAQRGCIVLRQSPMMVEGRYLPDQDRISVTVHGETLYDRLPEKLLKSVEDSGRTVILDDASTDVRLADDVYIRQNRPRSLVCMPLINQNKTVAVIYLENNLVTGAFTQERMKIINLLSRDMVFSLENASLYEELEQSEAKYRELVDNMQDGIFMIQNGRFVYVNHALAEMVGCPTDEMIGARYDAFIHPRDVERVAGYYENRIDGREAPQEYESALLHRDGSRVIMAINKVVGVSYRGQRAVQGTVKDITARKKAEQELKRHKDHLEEIVAERTEALERNNEELNRSLNLIERLSVTDELTGLFNRRHFNSVFAGSIARANNQRTPLAYLMLDIDHYKLYNDTYGHYEGDRVLKRLGDAIRELSAKQGGQSFAFRLGGEEFGILLPGMQREDAFAYAEKLRLAVAELNIEHAKNPQEGIVTASIGAVWMRGPGLDEEEAYKTADEALYRSKHGGRNRVTPAVQDGSSA